MPSSVKLTADTFRPPHPMTPSPNSTSAGSSSSRNDLVKDSLLYKEFLAEREEILRHKWIESEKAGHDIGFEKALLDWIVRHRSTWRALRSAPGSRSSAGAATSV